MPLSRGVARFNHLVTNRISLPVAGHLPGFGVVRHRGRKSGRVYRTPVSVFATAEGYMVALTYGPGSDWVKNVLAAGRCELETRGRRVPLVDPCVVTDHEKLWAPVVVQLMLDVTGVRQCLQLCRAPADKESS